MVDVALLPPELASAADVPRAGAGAAQQNAAAAAVFPPNASEGAQLVLLSATPSASCLFSVPSMFAIQRLPAVRPSSTPSKKRMRELSGLRAIPAVLAYDADDSDLIPYGAVQTERGATVLVPAHCNTTRPRMSTRPPKAPMTVGSPPVKETAWSVPDASSP